MQQLTAKEKVRLALDWVASRCEVMILTVLADWQLVEDPSCPTAWTNGPKLVYNPAFIDSLSLGAVRCVVLHEAAHVLLGHQFRLEGRNRTRYNIAADLAINGHLLPEYQAAYVGGTNKIAEILSLGCFPAHGPYQHLPSGKSAEWYYNHLSTPKSPTPTPTPAGGAGESGDSWDDAEAGDRVFEDGDESACGPEGEDAGSDTDVTGEGSGDGYVFEDGDESACGPADEDGSFVVR